MKTVIFVLSVILFMGSVLAQPTAGSATFKATVIDSLAYSFEVKVPTIKYDKKRKIAVIDMRKLREGRNLIGSDAKNGAQLYVVVKRSGTRTAIRGFYLRDRSGKFSSFGSPSSGPVPPEFGCPDGWLGKLICYTHPVYNETVCYTRCTPTQLTLRLP